MGERKVINKYFPPDFDHTKIPRPDRKKQERLKEKFVVRMMLPMSVRCLTCGEYMYKGKKFNSRKENVEGPEGQYLGIQIIRFYFKCVTCSAEFTVRTDPKSSDYVVEAGAKANFELYKAEAQEKAEIEAERAEGEKYDAMKKLENKTEESKRAMDILDALDEIRTQNARSASITVDDVLERRQKEIDSKAAAVESQVDAEDDLAAQRAFAAARVKRLRDEDVDEPVWQTVGSGSAGSLGTGKTTALAGSTGGSSSSTRPAMTAATAKAVASKRPKLPIGVVIQPKVVARSEEESASAAQAPHEVAASSSSGGGLLGLGVYDSSESGSSGSASPNHKQET